MKKEKKTAVKTGGLKIKPADSSPKFVNKTYKLTREVAPLSLILASRHTNRVPLLYFDEETGIKEGEMTGQEALVFNDEHVAIIEELTNRGDDEMLMKFMRQLLSQPQFQDQA